MLKLYFVDQNKPAIWLVESQYLIGSASHCKIQLNSSGVADEHAELILNGDDGQLKRLNAEAQIRVNGIPVKESKSVSAGDKLIIGSAELQLLDPKEKSPEKDNTLRQGSPWSLLAKNTALINKEFNLKDGMVIGRSAECDISLGVAHLSRHHARFYVTDTQLHVEDLQSSNGTYINGKKVAKAALLPGDELGFDTLTFRVQGPTIENLDQTVMRPSVKQEPQAKKASSSPAGASAARVKPAARAAAAPKTQQTPSASAEKESSSAWPLWLGLVAGVAVYFLFLR